MKNALIVAALFAAFNLNAQKPTKEKGDKPQVKKDEGFKKPPPRAPQKPFPRHWGPPPRIQTKDLRALPFGFGMGSSTLAAWIKKNAEADKAKGKERPQRPAPSPELRAKMKNIATKQASLRESHKELREQLKGQTKEKAAELIKAFRDSNREKHEELKKARQELLKDLRAKAQKGDRRE